MNALSFTATPRTGTVPLEVLFTAQDVAALKYVWTFGDGTTGEGLTVAHVYNAGGPYNVTLTAEFDGYGASVTKNAYIVASRPSDFQADFDGYLFSGASPSGPAPLQVIFSGLNSDADFTWDFGDGTAPLHMGQTGNPKCSHIFSSPGLFTVILSAKVIDPITKDTIEMVSFTRKNYVNVVA